MMQDYTHIRANEDDLNLLDELIYKERGELIPKLMESSSEEKTFLRKREHRLSKIHKRIEKGIKRLKDAQN